jgi:hypothetical protein
VVPPTTGRCIPLGQYKKLVDDRAKPTFTGTSCVFGTLSYWVENAESVRRIDRRRFESDSIYRRAIADLNVLTTLIVHGDGHGGNFIAYKDPADPRVFSVDNGISLGVRNPLDWFQADWASLRVPAIRAQSVERLRTIDDEDLIPLGAIEQYEKLNGQLYAVARVAPMAWTQAIRFVGQTLQIGMTRGEIEELQGRIDTLVKQVESGEVEVF